MGMNVYVFALCMDVWNVWMFIYDTMYAMEMNMYA